MIRKMSYFTILVDDQDRALSFYTEKLGFEKLADESLGRGQRWLVVGPKDKTDVGLVLARADTQEKKEALGHQGGGHVLIVFQTNDCRKTYQELKSKGVEFIGTPEERPAGMSVIFRDLYGNQFDLLQPKGWGG